MTAVKTPPYGRVAGQASDRADALRRALLLLQLPHPCIPALRRKQLGMGAALLNFLPGRMSFEQYFGWGDRSDDEKAVRFLVGLAPRGLHRPYLVDPSTVNLAEHRGPSSIMACQLCAGVAATEALKILLGRGKLLAAPHGFQFDAYRNKLTRTWRPGGNDHPLQRVALRIGMRQIARMRRSAA